MEGDPWECEVLPDSGYKFKIKKVKTQIKYRLSCVSNFLARVSSKFMPTMKMKNWTSRFHLRWLFIISWPRCQIKMERFAGARFDHFCGGHATSLCNDRWRASQELLLQTSLLSEIQVGKKSWKFYGYGFEMFLKIWTPRTSERVERVGWAEECAPQRLLQCQKGGKEILVLP